MTALLVVQGTVAMVGLAQAAGGDRFGDIVQRSVEAVAGTTIGQSIVQTIDNAQDVGESRRYLPLVLGGISWLVTATIAMAQLERALNRLYGIEQDRQFKRRYRLAAILAITIGLLVSGAIVAIAVGSSIGESLNSDLLSTLWSVFRLPLAFVALVLAIGVLFRWCPRRHQPSLSWMAFGSTISVLGVFAVSLALAVFLHLSSTFGETYGPLAGMVAVLLWAMLSSIAVLFGAAVAAQLEAVRAGTPGPQSEEKVADSEEHASEPVPALAGADC
jgi:YihY family inner membrane protein